VPQNNRREAPTACGAFPASFETFHRHSPLPAAFLFLVLARCPYSPALLLPLRVASTTIVAAASKKWYARMLLACRVTCTDSDCFQLLARAILRDFRADFELVGRGPAEDLARVDAGCGGDGGRRRDRQGAAGFYLLAAGRQIFGFKMVLESHLRVSSRQATTQEKLRN
jgi:hypothetical protein